MVSVLPEGLLFFHFLPPARHLPAIAICAVVTTTLQDRRWQAGRELRQGRRVSAESVTPPYSPLKGGQRGVCANSAT